MRQRKKKLGTHTLHIRLWTLRDKKALLRAQRPDVHIIELSVVTDKATVVIRTMEFEKPADATYQYDRMVELLG